ncbi:hypothetical protein [Pelagerythrobacter marensis]|uniref:Uncharacterized protein n=1 Tax=Pelagerythrobacter marensis TaxID=543877 RepID=A0A0G3X753_9SPHN|nr:hypothetical protein [Pelagerythrobacter marensis]AKM06461.1 hypothetical protein AM2010_373 [Pelagerythrobacter marensis]
MGDQRLLAFVSGAFERGLDDRGIAALQWGQALIEGRQSAMTVDRTSLYQLAGTHSFVRAGFFQPI